VTGTEGILAFLDRQHRTMAARIGAGESLPGAFNFARWNGEAVANMDVSFPVARALNDFVVGRLIEALDLNPSVASVHAVYGELASRVVAGGILKDDVAVGPFLVYRLLDRYGRLLYVGLTERGPMRLVEHAHRKAWWPFVVRVTFERFGSRAEAAARERFTIQTENPVYNVAGRDPVMARGR
jgi:hypothetical protein